MTEDFLHYIWQYSLFDFNNCKTTENEKLSVVFSGNYNTNTGPDFLYAQLKMGNQLWVGNIEIHQKSSDWYAHKHETDVNYDAVILHVVYQHDTVVYMKNNKPLPTLVLKDLIDENSYKKYQKLISQKTHWIACELQLPTIDDSFLWKKWLKQLYFERLEQKSGLIKNLLEKTNDDFEAVLFQLIAKNFGLKVNADAFLNLATSLNFSIIRKERFNEESLSALLFGQAGFLDDEQQNNYHTQLQKEYKYLAHKYKLKPINNNQFQFFRMRPSNFPTVRIAQLVALYNQHQNLFSKIINIDNLEDFYNLFSAGVNDFWKSHYTFEATSKKSAKKLTKSFIDLLIINTIVPLKYVYLQSRGNSFKNDIFALMHQIKPEKNVIISNFAKLNIIAKNALESQALIQLKSEYCTPKYCLKCAIGNHLLK